MKVEIRSKVVILLCIVLAVFSSCITDDDDDRGDFALVAGDALPQFSVEMSDGGMLNTQSFSGKVGVIVFFHTDFPDCQQIKDSRIRCFQRMENYCSCFLFLLAAIQG